MKPAVTFFSNAETYYSAIEPFLSADEVTNSLVLGVVRNLARQISPRRRHQPVMAAVALAGKIVIAAVMPTHHKLLLAGPPNETESVDELIRSLFRERINVPSVLGPSELASSFAHLWASAVNLEHVYGIRQRLYQCTQATLPASMPDGRLIFAPPEDRELLSRWVLAFYQEALPDEAGDLTAAQIIIDRIMGNNDLYIWQADSNGQTQAVSMAARARPTIHGIAINLVYTPPEHRRKGYASACVAHLTKLLLSSGWNFCSLFTDRDNSTSNHIYQDIGYTPVTDFDEFRFKSPLKSQPNNPNKSLFGQ